jgi:hypothetical protein
MFILASGIVRVGCLWGVQQRPASHPPHHPPGRRRRAVGLCPRRTCRRGIVIVTIIVIANVVVRIKVLIVRRFHRDQRSIQFTFFLPADHQVKFRVKVSNTGLTKAVLIEVAYRLSL